MKAPRFGFTVAQKDPEVFELDVYDVIGDTWEEDAVTARSVRAQLKECRAPKIRVRINSLGGDVQDALSIYNQLREHPADVEVKVDGAAASAATIIAMAASPGQLRMAEASEFMIHEPRFDFMVYVDAAKARKAADRLDKESGILAGIYTKRSERSEEEIRDWMRAETWFTASEALEAGLIDGLDDESSTASISPTMAAAALQRFRNVPERMVARAGVAPVTGNGGALVGVAVPLGQSSSGREKAAGAEATISPPTINVTPGTDPAAVERALIEKLAAPVQGVIVPPAESTPAAAVAALVRQPAAEAASPQEHRMDPKSLARDLGLPEDATEIQIRTAVTTAHTDRKTLLDALGVSTVDAARGLVEAGRAAASELPKAQARVAELEKASEERERSAVIAKLESEKRITPAQRDGFCKTASLETLKAFAESAPVIVAESQHREAPASGAAGATATVTHNGKSYEALTGPERIALRESDKDTFNALRNDWLSRGQPLANPAG